MVDFSRDVTKRKNTGIKMASQKKYKKSHKTCSVEGCNKTDNDDVTFHLFPHKNPEIVKKWTDFVNRNRTSNGFTPEKWSFVCSAHFEPTAYPSKYALEMSLMGTTTKRKVLKPDAYPTLDLEYKSTDDVYVVNHDVGDRKRKCTDDQGEVKIFAKSSKK